MALDRANSAFAWAKETKVMDVDFDGCAGSAFVGVASMLALLGALITHHSFSKSLLFALSAGVGALVVFICGTLLFSFVGMLLLRSGNSKNGADGMKPK